MLGAPVSITKDEWVIEGMVEGGGFCEVGLEAALPVVAKTGVRDKHGRRDKRRNKGAYCRTVML